MTMLTTNASTRKAADSTRMFFFMPFIILQVMIRSADHRTIVFAFLHVAAVADMKQKGHLAAAPLYLLLFSMAGCFFQISTWPVSADQAFTVSFLLSSRSTMIGEAMKIDE
jgi:hypothetical protein